MKEGDFMTRNTTDMIKVYDLDKDISVLEITNCSRYRKPNEPKYEYYIKVRVNDHYRIEYVFGVDTIFTRTALQNMYFNGYFDSMIEDLVI